MRRLVAVVRGALVFAALAVGVAELGLRAASFAVHGREAADAVPGARRVVCIGDSHTYGSMVPAEESYPGHLGRLLEERAPGAFAVVNLGIPGQSTAQVRERLHAALAAERPGLVIVWCGVNDAWNRGGATRAAGWRGALDRLLGRLRIVRLVRVWRHDAALERVLHQQRYDVVMDPRDPERTFTIRNGEESEEIHYADGEFRADAEMEARAEADYRAMVADARAAGVPIVFIAYPVDWGAFHLANRAMRRVATESGAPLVEAARAALRVPPEQRQLLAAGHPNGAIYAEVARDLVPIVLGGGAALAPAASLVRLEATGPPSAEATTGPCATVETDCPHGRCYRWNPSRAVCHFEAALSEPVAAVRASVRLRIASFPESEGGHDVLGLFEDVYASGVYVELIDERLSLLAWGGARVRCGPLAPRLVRGTWYQVTVRAEKAEAAQLALELRDADGTPIDAVSCAGLSTGGGSFTRVRLGNASPAGTVADVLFDDVQVRAGAAPD